MPQNFCFKTLLCFLSLSLSPSLSLIFIVFVALDLYYPLRLSHSQLAHKIIFWCNAAVRQCCCAAATRRRGAAVGFRFDFDGDVKTCFLSKIVRVTHGGPISRSLSLSLTHTHTHSHNSAPQRILALSHLLLV